MNIIILLLATVIVFKLLFNSFTVVSKKDNLKKEEAISNFTKNNKIFKDNNYSDCNFICSIINNSKSKNNNLEEINNKKIVEVFDKKKFIKSAERSIVFIMEAITKKDFLILKQLLTIEMFNKINKLILNFENLNEKYTSVIISLFSEIGNINKLENEITLDVNIEKIEYIENEICELVSGSKNNTIKVKEKWTFIKTMIENKDIWLLKSISM